VAGVKAESTLVLTLLKQSKAIILTAKSFQLFGKGDILTVAQLTQIVFTVFRLKPLNLFNMKSFPSRTAGTGFMRFSCLTGVK